MAGGGVVPRGILSPVVNRLIVSVIMTDNSRVGSKLKSAAGSYDVQPLILWRVLCLIIIVSVSCVSDGPTTSYPVQNIPGMIYRYTGDGPEPLAPQTVFAKVLCVPPDPHIHLRFPP